MTGYWIEDRSNHETGFDSLTLAKKRARVLMRVRMKHGDPAPLVHVIADDNSEAHHFDNFSQRWHVDTH